jgi:hypothetical protein
MWNAREILPKTNQRKWIYLKQEDPKNYWHTQDESEYISRTSRKGRNL